MLIDEERAEAIYAAWGRPSSRRAARPATRCRHRIAGRQDGLYRRSARRRFGSRVPPRHHRGRRRFATPGGIGRAGDGAMLDSCDADSQRTMNTFLGACVNLGPADIDAALIRGALVTYLEGYFTTIRRRMEAFHLRLRYRARSRPQSRALAFRRVLREPPPRRFPQARRPSRRRSLRQRSRSLDTVRDERVGRSDRTAARDDRYRRRDARPARLDRGDQRATVEVPRLRSRTSWIRREPAICTRPAFCSAHARRADARMRAIRQPGCVGDHRTFRRPAANAVGCAPAITRAPGEARLLQPFSTFR